MCGMALSYMLFLVLPVPSLSAHVLLNSSNVYIFVNRTKRCFNISYKYLYVSHSSRVHSVLRHIPINTWPTKFF